MKISREGNTPQYITSISFKEGGVIFHSLITIVIYVQIILWSSSWQLHREGYYSRVAVYKPPHCKDECTFELSSAKPTDSGLQKYGISDTVRWVILHQSLDKRETAYVANTKRCYRPECLTPTVKGSSSKFCNVVNVGRAWFGSTFRGKGHCKSIQSWSWPLSCDKTFLCCPEWYCFHS